MTLQPYVSVGLDETLERQIVLRRAIELFEAGDLSSLAEYYNQNVPRGRIRIELRVQPTGKNCSRLCAAVSHRIFCGSSFALHAASEAKLFRCERCGSPFRVGTGTGRRDNRKILFERVQGCRLPGAAKEKCGAARDERSSNLTKGQTHDRAYPTPRDAQLGAEISTSAPTRLTGKRLTRYTASREPRKRRRSNLRG